MTQLWTIVAKPETLAGHSANINGPQGNLKILPATSNAKFQVMGLAKRVAAIPAYEAALRVLSVHSDECVRIVALEALEKGGI